MVAGEGDTEGDEEGRKNRNILEESWDTWGGIVMVGRVGRVGNGGRGGMVNSRMFRIAGGYRETGYWVDMGRGEGDVITKLSFYIQKKKKKKNKNNL